MVPRILFAIGCLITIWGLGAGNPAIFDSRAPLLSLLWASVALCGLLCLRIKAPGLAKNETDLRQQKTITFYLHSARAFLRSQFACTPLPKLDATALTHAVTWGAPLSLVVTAPFLVLFFGPFESLRGLVGFEATLTYLRATSPASMAALVLILVPSWAIVSRGFLQSWGVSGVALLDGLTVGFSSQRLLLFLWVWVSSLMWGQIGQRKGFWVAFVCQVLSTILLACLVRLK